MQYLLTNRKRELAGPGRFSIYTKRHSFPTECQVILLAGGWNVKNVYTGFSSLDVFLRSWRFIKCANCIAISRLGAPLSNFIWQKIIYYQHHLVELYKELIKNLADHHWYQSSVYEDGCHVAKLPRADFPCKGRVSQQSGACCSPFFILMRINDQTEIFCPPPPKGGWGLEEGGRKGGRGWGWKMTPDI